MRAIGEPLRIEDIQVDRPGLREALVEPAMPPMLTSRARGACSGKSP